MMYNRNMNIYPQREDVMKPERRPVIGAVSGTVVAIIEKDASGREHFFARCHSLGDHVSCPCMVAQDKYRHGYCDVVNNTPPTWCGNY
jgi:hypothetical protein